MDKAEPRENTLRDAFDGVVDVLATSSVPYALIGGLAVAFHGLPRSTRDIDLLWSIPRIALPSVLEKLSQRGFTFRLDEVIRELGEDHFSRISFHGVRVDILEAVLPLFRGVVERAKAEAVRGRTVRVAAPGDLVALKLLAGRENDLADVKAILAAQGAKLDLEPIRRSLAECGRQDQIETLNRLASELS